MKINKMSYTELAEELKKLEESEQIKMYRKIKAKMLEMCNSISFKSSPTGNYPKLK